MDDFSQKHSDEAKDFLEDLTKNLPRLPYEPTLIPMLFAATSEKLSVSIDTISLLVERSPNLASRVLAVANSAAFAPSSSITSLSRAITLLGFHELRSLLVTVGAVSVMEKMSLPLQFNGHALWQHQIQTATLARSLCLALRDTNITQTSLLIHPDDLYSAALLHDMGAIFFASLKPELWLALRKEAFKADCTIAEKEQEYWGIDHGIIGATVLKAWGLPELLTTLVAHHHSPEKAKEYSTYASLLCAADILAHDPPAMDDEELSEQILALLPPLQDPALFTVLTIEACAAAGANTTLLNSMM